MAHHPDSTRLNKAISDSGYCSRRQADKLIEEGKIQNGEGISSLGRAFAYANCPNQLISLWPANDKSTTQLMTYYYENLKAGLGKSKALTEAKRKYLASAPEIFKHPYYWAGFVYYGQDDPLNLGSNMPLWAWGLICIGILAIILFNRRKIQALF